MSGRRRLSTRAEESDADGRFAVHEVEVSAKVEPFGPQEGGAPHEVHVGEDRPLRTVEERRAAEEGELAHGDEVAVAACERAYLRIGRTLFQGGANVLPRCAI